MINTIFYYPQSKAEYDTEYQAGNIAARTISFVPDEKAIYKGGIRYGSTSISDLKTQIEQIFSENPYTLPIATASRLGGIMIGDGFRIDANTGKLDVDFSGITNGTSGTNGHNGMDGLIKTIFDSVTNIRASENNYGIVKIGRGIDVVDGVISVNITDVANASVPTISAAATVDNTTGTPSVTVVKTGTNAAPTFTFNFSGIKGEKGNTGATGPQGPAGTTTGGGTTTVQYDDTELRGLIDALDRELDGLSDTADDEKDRLDGVIKDLDQNIQNKIEGLFDDATWIQNNWPAGQTGSTSNFGQSDVEAYLQQIGVWTTDDNGNTITQWSKIAQDVNSLTTTVAGLQVQAGDTSAITALQSSLEQYVDTQIGTATNNLSTTYARKSAEDVLEWMYSALKQQSSADKTFNELVSAGKSGLSSAISEVRTYVEKLKNGDYIATSSIESKVDDAIAGLKNSASSNNAKTEIFNKISQNSDDISGIVTSITGDSGSAAIGTKISNWKAGLITTVNASTKAAEAGLAVANDVTAAGIVAKINGSDDSAVYINADKIKIDGKHQLDLSSQKINVNADDLVMSTSHILAIKGDSVTFDAAAITALESAITAKSLSIVDGTKSIAINSTDGIKQTISNTVTNQIAQDGSGSLASGNISWNTSGNTVITGDFQTGNSGYVCKMNGGSSSYASILLTDGTNTPVKISGTSSNGGWLELTNVSDGTRAILYGTSLRFATSSNTADDAVNIQYVHSTGQLQAWFGNTSNPHEWMWNTSNFAKYYVEYDSNNVVRIESDSTSAKVQVEDGSGINTISSTGQSASSDMRLKDVIANKELTAKQIADAPIFTYTPKSNPNANPIIGTSAQYWQEVLPETVSEINNYLSLDYSRVATASVINLAKEVVTLKEEKAALIERIEALEARLQVIESKLNA